MNETRRRSITLGVKIIGYVALFCVTFVFFLYLTFPYEVLKETLAGEISQSSGYTVHIGELTPSFPLGLTAKRVRVEAPGGAQLNLSSVDASVSVLSLFLAKVAAEAEIHAGKGKLVANVGFGVFDLISGVALPRRLEVVATAFPVEEAARFGLASAAGSDPMVGPILTKIGIVGNLNAKIDLKLDPRVPTQSSGTADLVLSNAVLKLSDPTLGLPDQTFKHAQAKARIEDGSLVIDKQTGLVSDELELTAEGKIGLKPQMPASTLDLRIGVKLDKGLKDMFGSIVDAWVGSGTGEGRFTLQLRGTVGAPVPLKS
jgi:type II secretion system protein N